MALAFSVRRVSGKMMHEGAVNVMAEGAGGGTLPMTSGTVMAPAGKTPKMKGRRRLKENTGFYREAIGRVTWAESPTWAGSGME